MEQPRPEDKDWTWVLDRPCPQCGFDADTVDRAGLAARIRSSAAVWRAVLGRGPVVALRPPDDPDRGPVWSALEYGSHARDVYHLMAERLRLMLTKNDPQFLDWDPDAAAVEQRYAEQDPQRVGYDLAVEAGKVADILDRVRDNQWTRAGRRSDGQTFTVEGLATYLFHDVVHHLHDVEAGFRALAAGEGEGDEDGDDDGADDDGGAGPAEEEP